MSVILAGCQVFATGLKKIAEDIDFYCTRPKQSLANPRSRLQFLTPLHGDLMANIDAVSTADFTVFALSGTQEASTWGETCLRSLASIGVGEGAVRGVVSVRIGSQFAFWSR